MSQKWRTWLDPTCWPRGFFAYADTDPQDGNTLFIRVVNVKGGKTLSLVIIIVLRDLSNRWGIKILFSYTSSYGFLQQGRACITCSAYKQQTFNYSVFQVKFYEDMVIFCGLSLSPLWFRLISHIWKLETAQNCSLFFKKSQFLKFHPKSTILQKPWYLYLKWPLSWCFVFSLIYDYIYLL